MLAPGALERWSSLPQAELGKWRREYWNRVERKTPAGAKRATYLDKLPMNLAVLPVIHLLFPDAKFILALRDPRDVIVSCFRNHFAVNAAMYQFLSLEGAARYYDAVMTSAEVARERLPLALHVVRYEDVVADLRGEAMRLMEFLGQPVDRGRAEIHGDREPARDLHAERDAGDPADLHDRRWGSGGATTRSSRPCCPCSSPGCGSSATRT